MKTSVNYVFGGSVPDLNPEVSSSDKGDVYLRKGMRSYGGVTDSIKSTEAYAAFIGGYTCIGACYVLNQVVTVWANGSVVMIAVDSVEVLKTADIPYTTSSEVDVIFSTDVDNGEIFLNDREHSPLVFSIKSMLDAQSAGETTYTADFNLNLYKPTIEFSMNRMVFQGLVNVGQGLKVGSYNYSYRLVNKDGDRTQWSVSSPFIPVVKNVSVSGDTYKGIKTHGGEAGSNTKYGIKLKVRIHNTSNFSFVELKRVSYADGASQGVAPIIESRKLIKDADGNVVNIKDNELQVLDIMDTSEDEWFVLAEDDDIAMGRDQIVGQVVGV